MNLSLIFNWIKKFTGIILLLSLTACSSPIHSKKYAYKETRLRDAIASADQQVSENLKDSLKTIASLSHGTDRSLSIYLNQITNNPPEILLASELNQRIQSLSGSPNFQEIKAMNELVDLKLSSDPILKRKGENKIEKLDQKIESLQHEKEQWIQKKDDEIEKYIHFGTSSAEKNDEFAQKLNQMDKWFGFGAIEYGFRKLFKSVFLLILVILLVIIVLRIAANFSPLAAGIFSIFDVMFSWVIHFVKRLAPNAFQISGLVKKEDFSQYKFLLIKLVDQIQILREIQKKSPEKFSVDDLILELSKSLSPYEKELIRKIKEELLYR